MSEPQFTPYLDGLKQAMKMCMERENSIFIGQQIVHYGNPMSKTIEGLPKEKMIETPVMEETQMGITLGLGMMGYNVVSFYPRWDFLISATNQLVNHLDKIEHMSDGGWCPNVIIRVGKGSDNPLDPGVQHKGNYVDSFRTMLKYIPIFNLDSYNKIIPTYEKILNSSGPAIIVEYPELYYS